MKIIFLIITLLLLAQCKNAEPGKEVTELLIPENEEEEEEEEIILILSKRFEFFKLLCTRGMLTECSHYKILSRTTKCLIQKGIQ